jgi:TolA-binding protein
MNLLSNEQHISQQHLLRYVEDDCSRLEMREIDRHLATCPMCSDAVEGLMLLTDPSVAVAQLDKRIDEKVTESNTEKPVGTSAQQEIEKPILQVIKRPFWQQRWAAAAAVLLLASGSIWVYKGTQSDKSQAVTSSEIQILPNTALENSATASENTLTDTLQYAAAQTRQSSENLIHLSTPNDVTTTLRSPQGMAQNTPQNTEANQDITGNTDSDTQNRKAKISSKPNDDFVEVPPAAYKTGKTRISADTALTYTPTARARDYTEASAQKSTPRPREQEATLQKELAEEKKQTNTDKIKEEVVVSTELKAQKKPAPVATSAAKKSSSETAPVKPTTSSVTPGAYPSGGYTTPTTDYDQVFNRAESYFKEKNYDAAAKEYAQFVSLNTSGDRPERALFQLANCYLKLNKKADAKILFEKLSATNGQYQRAAKKALKDL